jgi:hypothetical protein
MVKCTPCKRIEVLRAFCVLTLSLRVEPIRKGNVCAKADDFVSAADVRYAGFPRIDLMSIGYAKTRIDHSPVRSTRALLLSSATASLPPNDADRSLRFTVELHDDESIVCLGSNKCSRLRGSLPVSTDVKNVP